MTPISGKTDMSANQMGSIVTMLLFPIQELMDEQKGFGA
jgi:hypothetical protein